MASGIALSNVGLDDGFALARRAVGERGRPLVGRFGGLFVDGVENCWQVKASLGQPPRPYPQQIADPVTAVAL